MKCLLVAFLLVFALLLSNSFVEPTMATVPADSSFCAKKCKFRCSKAGMQDRCLRYCNICCGICKCVPPGTYGNKERCACYASLKSSKGKSKCP